MALLPNGMTEFEQALVKAIELEIPELCKTCPPHGRMECTDGKEEQCAKTNELLFLIHRIEQRAERRIGNGAFCRKTTS